MDGAPNGQADDGDRGAGAVLVTGGAGFVGANLADALLRAGRRVIVLDNLSRAGVETNLDWLVATHDDRLDVVVADVRDAAAVRRAVSRACEVYHLAAQVAVTTSLDDPVLDFDVNARGTLNVLEAIRAQRTRPSLVFTSTNKVYGALDDVTVVRAGDRYLPTDTTLRSRGLSEERPLDFHSPYGCSKGSADQYVRDYARSYGIPTVVFRMSCIYGPHQFGTEDQGWVAHFLLRALDGLPVTIFGDGMQVRDVLFVDDLVAALRGAMSRAHALAGRAFNIGGGPRNAISLQDLLAIIERLHGSRPSVSFDGWRVGDQRYYVSDTGAFAAAAGWRAQVAAADGVARLYRWLCDARGVTDAPLAAIGASRGAGASPTSAVAAAAVEGR